MFLISLDEAIAESLLPFNDQLEDTRSVGLFATYIPSGHGAQSVRPNTHLLFMPIGEESWQSYEELVRNAAVFVGSPAAAGLDLQRDEELVLPEIISWLQKHHTSHALTILADDLGETLSEDESSNNMTTLARYVRYFALVGDWFRIKIIDPHEETRWYVS